MERDLVVAAECNKKRASRSLSMKNEFRVCTLHFHISEFDPLNKQREQVPPLRLRLQSG